MLSVLERPRSVAANTYGFVVESGIPMPPRTYGFGFARYPFALMNVGDSFEVPLSSSRSKRPSIAKLQSNLHNCAGGYAKAHNPAAKFSIRKTSDTTLRVWRIA
jgi:hypothetical protein